MGPYGGENFKMPLLAQVLAKSFQTFLNFFPNGPHKTTFGIFDNWNFNDFFFVFVNMEHYGSENFKTLLLKITAKCFSTFLSWFFFPMVLTKLRLGFLKFWVSDF